MSSRPSTSCLFEAAAAAASRLAPVCGVCVSRTLEGAVPTSERGRETGDLGRETFREAEAEAEDPAPVEPFSSGGDGTAEEAAVVPVVKEDVDAGIEGAELPGALCPGVGPSVAAEERLPTIVVPTFARRGMTLLGCMTMSCVGDRRDGGDRGGEWSDMSRKAAAEVDHRCAYQRCASALYAQTAMQ